MRGAACAAVLEVRGFSSLECVGRAVGNAHGARADHLSAEVAKAGTVGVAYGSKFFLNLAEILS